MKIIEAGDFETAGTFFQAHFRATYTELSNLLGLPIGSDGYKVSTQWAVKYYGQLFTIYDYKDTNLYDESYPSVQRFRNQKDPIYWNVGGTESAEGFLYYLAGRLSSNNELLREMEINND